MSAMDVLEEVTEDNLVRYMEGMDVGLEWFVEQLRGLGGAMGDYRRYAGEVEARNVQRRADFSPWMRENLPFNATLDPGEAIVDAGAPTDVRGTRYEVRFGRERADARGDISMSVRNLAAVHTLSVEKFLAAGKMGGCRCRVWR